MIDFLKITIPHILRAVGGVGGVVGGGGASVIKVKNRICRCGERGCLEVELAGVRGGGVGDDFARDFGLAISRGDADVTGARCDVRVEVDGQVGEIDVYGE